MALMMDETALNAFLDSEFLQVKGEFLVEEVTADAIRMRLLVGDRHLRPGNTISGPSMFSLADVSAYLLTLAQIGPQALAVTTNCAIDFMRKPSAGVDLIAQGRLLKLGRVLSVSDVLIFSEGSDKPVARASMTYSIPPGPK